MRNANLEDERKLHEHGEFDTNVMFQWQRSRYHIKRVGYPLWWELNRSGDVIAEHATTGVLHRFNRTNLLAINRGSMQPSQKKPRIKPHVKGTRPEKLVPYDSKLMNKPRWVKLRDGARCYAEACGELLSLDGTMSLWLQSGKRYKEVDSRSNSDIIGIYLPFEEWNITGSDAMCKTYDNMFSVRAANSDGWISGIVPKDGNSYFVKSCATGDVLVAVWSFYHREYVISGTGYATCCGWIAAYKPVEHEGLYKYGC